MKKIEFSFDWIIRDTDNRKTELLDFYKQGQWDVVLVEVQLRMHGNEFSTHYEAGNPLLGGVKSFKTLPRARRYFRDMVGDLVRSGAR